MNAERWKKIESLFEAASAMDVGARGVFLDRECDGDAGLRAEVESLLGVEEDEAGFSRFLQTPAFVIPTPPPTKMIASAEPATMVGRRIGSYRITGVIGSGGMGVVYLAEQEFPRRTVALKVLKPSLATPGMIRRFEHEAEILGRLQHAGIAQIYEAGAAPDHENPLGSGVRAYFAMEYVRGPTITAFVRDRGLPTAERLELVAKACDAVQHAHQKGVIHRDLKPANILVDVSSASVSSGGGAQPKVLDFGVARVTDSDRRVTTIRTNVGQLIGTLSYMSPEQVSGDPDGVDTRSDVYALGVLLYELLSGKLPHDVSNRSIPEAARMIRDDEPARLSSMSRVFRGEIDTIVAKAIEKHRERRYQSAAALGEDLRRYLAGEPIAAKRDSALYVLRKQINRYRGVVATAALFVIALVVFAVVMIFQSMENKRLAVERLVLSQEADLARRQALSALDQARAQRRRADESAVGLRRQLCIANIERGRLLATTGSPVLAEDLMWAELLRDPSSAPAYWALWELYSKYPIVKSVPGVSAAVRAFAFAPSGQRAFVATEDGLITEMTGDLSRVLGVTRLPASYLVFLQCAADDDRLMGGDYDGNLWLIDRGAPARMLLDATEAPTPDGWLSPDGLAAVTPSSDGLVREWDLTGEPRVARVSRVPGRAISVGVSPDRRTAVVGLFDGALHRVRLGEDVAAEEIEARGRSARCFAFSADGTRLAVGGDVGKVEVFDVTTEPWRVTASFSVSKERVRSLAFAADGRTLVSSSDSIQTWDARDGRRIRTVLGSDPMQYQCKISPDGGTLVTHGRERTLRVFEMNPELPVRSVSCGLGWIFDAPISPDGADFALVSNGETVQVRDARTLHIRLQICGHVGRVYRADYSPDGSILATGGNNDGVRLWDARTGEFRRAWAFGGGTLLSIRFTPDGTRLVCGGSEGRITVHRVSDGVIVAEMNAPRETAFSIAISSDGRTVFSTGSDEFVRLWDLESGGLIGELQCESQPRALQLSHDNATLYVGTFGRKVEEWDLRRVERVRSMSGHQHAVLSLSLSPDGRILASGAADRTVRLWEVGDEHLLATLEGPLDQVSSVKFHPGGRALIASDAQSRVYRWDLSGQERHIAGNFQYQFERHAGIPIPASGLEQMRRWSTRVLGAGPATRAGGPGAGE